MVMSSSGSSVPRLYVGNLSRHAIEKDLWLLFDHYRPSAVHVKQGFGFIEFESRRDCSDALKNLNNSRVCDLRIRLEMAKNHDRPRAPRPRVGRSQYKLIVKNISSRMNWKDLKNFFRRWVEVAHADCNDHIPGTGEVYFDNKEDMKYAYKRINGELFFGRPIKVIRDSDYHERSRSRSPSGYRRKHAVRRRSYSSESRYSRKRSVASNHSYSASPRSAHSRNGNASKRSESYASYASQSSVERPNKKLRKQSERDDERHDFSDHDEASKGYSSDSMSTSLKVKHRGHENSSERDAIIIPKVKSFRSEFKSLQTMYDVISFLDKEISKLIA